MMQLGKAVQNSCGHLIYAISGKDRVHLFDNIHSRVHHEDHRIRICAAPWIIPEKRMELS